MTYKILQLSSTSSNIEYWNFIKMDETSTTDYSTTSLDELEVKLKILLKSVPITKLKVVSEILFTDDLIFTP